MSIATLVWIWIAIGLITFIYLLFKPAPYGRHVSPGWGPVLKNSIAWILMEIPVFITVLTYLVANFQEVEWPGKVLVSLFLLHYFNRCLIYPFRIKPSHGKMPLTIVLSAVLFNLVNGNIIGFYMTSSNTMGHDSPQFLMGCLLFIVGMVINIKSDETLIKMRRDSDEYIVPKGGLYEYISSPNYFGEMLEWLGFAIAAGNLGAWSFFIWTLANLFPRAISNHKWYKAKFPGYPAGRRAVVPFVI